MKMDVQNTDDIFGVFSIFLSLMKFCVNDSQLKSLSLEKIWYKIVNRW